MRRADRPECKEGQIWRDRSYETGTGGRRYLRVVHVATADELPYYSVHGEVTMERVKQDGVGRWISMRKQTTMKLNAGGAPKSSSFVLVQDVTQ